MKIAYFSPLPPSPSGISDYSADLLPYLSDLVDVTVVAEKVDSVNADTLGKVTLCDYQAFEATKACPEPSRRDGIPLSINVYQMGNSPYHRYIYPFILRYPGIVVLHDYVLHHFLAGISLGAGKEGNYLLEMGYNLGRAGLDMAHQVLEGKASPPLFEEPLSRRVLDSSLGIIVHSSYVRDLILRERPLANVKVIPMGIPIPQEMPREQARGVLGLDKDAFIIASFGEASPHKRIDVVARTFAKLREDHANSLYIIVGNTMPSLDVHSMVEDLGLGDAVQVTGFVDKDMFTTYMMAADVCVNLRYPTAGETSASTLRTMAAGRATIISDVGAAQDLPDSVCIKIGVGGDEEEQLAGCLKSFIENRNAADTLGRVARQYIAEKHTLQGAARRYVSFINEVLNSSPLPIRNVMNDVGNSLDDVVLNKIASELSALGVTGDDNNIIGMVSRLAGEVGIRNAANWRRAKKGEDGI